jgi:glycosyltransferase involved in cell wall biosynthesis
MSQTEADRSTEPTISIVTATYNAAALLPRLVASLTAQTDQDFEWVVADGGSNDDTLKIAEEARASLKQVVLTSQPDFGIYDALNRAIKRTTAEYYLVIGADDVLDPSAVANFKRLGSQTRADILTAAVDYGGRCGILRRPRGSAWLRGAMAYVTGHAVGAAFKKSLHDRKSVGLYSKTYPICADQLFIKRVIKSGASVAVGDFLAGSFGVNGISSTNIAGVHSEFFRVQLETERFKSLQVLLHILRLLKNFPKLLE